MTAALTIASVDNTTDQITITAHGLVTGDGPGTIYTAAGTYPGGLTAVTDTWVIRIDANTIKLATSNANAMAGTAINITSNGSGTLLYLVGVPYRRPRTYSTGSQLKHVDLNDNFDSWTAVWNLLTGQAQSVWSSVTLAVPLAAHHDTVTLQIHGTAFQPITSSTAVDYSSNGCQFTGGSGVIAPAPLLQGRHITAARFFIHDNATGPSVLQCELERLDNTGSNTGNVSSGSSGAGADQTITVNPTSGRGDVLSHAAHALRVFYSSGSAQCRVYLVELDYNFLT